MVWQMPLGQDCNGTRGNAINRGFMAHTTGNDDDYPVVISHAFNGMQHQIIERKNVSLFHGNGVLTATNQRRPGQCDMGHLQL